MLASPRFAMLGFMAVTVLQIVVFVGDPRVVYGPAAELLDKPPAFVFFRLIGIKEVGLMTIYTAALRDDGDVDRYFVYITILGRLSTLIFMSWIVFGLGGPLSAYQGIIQDVVFGLWSLYTLNMAPASPSPTETPPMLVCIAIGVAGVLETWHGLSVMLNPTAAASDGFGELLQADMSVAPLHLGYRSLGFMTGLIGAYQVAIAVQQSSLTTKMAFAVLFHHIADYVLLGAIDRSGLLQVQGSASDATVVQPLQFQLVCGLLLAGAMAIAAPAGSSDRGRGGGKKQA